MSKEIVSQRFGYPLNLGSVQFEAAGGSVHHTQPNGGAGAPPMLQRKSFNATEATQQGMYFEGYRDLLDFNDSIFLKRWRICPQIAAPFYGMYNTAGSDYVSFLWFNTVAIGEGRDPDQTERIFCKIPAVQVGEWSDVNMFIPRPDNLDGLPHQSIGVGYYLGSFLPSMDLLYSAVPAALVGVDVNVWLEVELAHTLGPLK